MFHPPGTPLENNFDICESISGIAEDSLSKRRYRDPILNGPGSPVGMFHPPWNTTQYGYFHIISEYITYLVILARMFHPPWNTAPSCDFQ